MEEVKPLENPATALSKKASDWLLKQQNQPRPMQRGGGDKTPSAVTTFYPNWKKATTHSSPNQPTKIIVPLLRNTKAWYFYPTLRRAVFTLNPDSSVANAQIIEVITRSNEVLTKYETQLFLNPDATGLKDFTGYVLEYDVQYTRTKFSGFEEGTLTKDNPSLETGGTQGGTNWDCGDNGNPVNTNPSNPVSNNPPNGNGGVNWIIFIGGIPGMGTPGNLLGQPFNPMTTIGGSFGGGNFGGSSSPYPSPTIIQPIQLADIAPGYEGSIQNQVVNGLVPNGSANAGDIIDSEILERKAHDTGDSRKNNGNPCGGGESEDNQPFFSKRVKVNFTIPSFKTIHKYVSMTDEYKIIINNFDLLLSAPDKKNIEIVFEEANLPTHQEGKTEMDFSSNPKRIIVKINRNLVRQPHYNIARVMFHELQHVRWFAEYMKYANSNGTMDMGILQNSNSPLVDHLILYSQEAIDRGHTALTDAWWQYNFHAILANTTHRNEMKSFLQNYLKSTTKATFGVSALQGIQAEINNPNSTLNQGIGLMTWHGLDEVKAFTDLDETYKDNIRFLNLVGLSPYVSPNPPTN